MEGPCNLGKRKDKPRLEFSLEFRAAVFHSYSPSHSRHAFCLSTVLDCSPFCTYTRNTYHIFPFFSSFRSSPSLKTRPFDFSPRSDIFVPLCGRRFTSRHCNRLSLPPSKILEIPLDRFLGCGVSATRLIGRNDDLRSGPRAESQPQISELPLL